eukprot:gene9446-1652_t
MKRKMEEENIEKKELQEIKNEIVSNLKFTTKFSVLDEMKKQKCEKCNKSRRFFCYSCMIPMNNTEQIPNVKLPIKVIIIQHPKELKSKSTAIHAKILSPDNVEIYQYPEMPDFLTNENSMILYPSKDSVSFETITKQLKDEKSNKQENYNSKLAYLVFIDATWNQAKQIARDERIQSLRKLKITSQKTLFWRYQQLGDDHLATIEAIYYTLKEYQIFAKGEYNSEFDDLLFYYVYFYQLIQETYQDESKVYRHKDGYIKKIKKE